MEIRSHKVGKSQAWQALNRKRNKKKAAPVKPETFAGESTCWRSGRDRVWFYKKIGDCGDAQWRLTIRPTRVTRKTRILERFGLVEFAEKIGASTRTIPPWRPAPQTRTQQLSKTARVPITQSAFSVWRNKKRFRFQPSLLFLPVSFIFVAASLSRQSIHITSSSWWWRHGKRFNANCRQFPQLVKQLKKKRKKNTTPIAVANRLVSHLLPSRLKIIYKYDAKATGEPTDFIKPGYSCVMHWLTLRYSIYGPTRQATDSWSWEIDRIKSSRTRSCCVSHEIQYRRKWIIK